MCQLNSLLEEGKTAELYDTFGCICTDVEGIARRILPFAFNLVVMAFICAIIAAISFSLVKPFSQLCYLVAILNIMPSTFATLFACSYTSTGALYFLPWFS